MISLGTPPRKTNVIASMANVSNSETITRLYACPSITLVKLVQWNPVNMDTKVTCHNVCIIRVSILSGQSEKMSQTHVSLIRRLKQTFLLQL